MKSKSGAYDTHNGNLLSMIYENGTEVEYRYDVLDRITEILYNDTVRYRYSYNGDGALASSEDVLYSYITYYEYDGIGRIVSQKKYSSVTGEFVEGESYDYDTSNRVKQTVSLGKYTDSTTSFGYNSADGTLQAVYAEHTNVDAWFNYTYDPLKRLSVKSLTHHADTTNVTDGYVITIYRFKNIDDYYESIHETSGGKLEIEHDRESEFVVDDDVLEYNDSTYFHYYAYVEGLNEDCSITIDGKEIKPLID